MNFFRRRKGLARKKLKHGGKTFKINSHFVIRSNYSIIIENFDLKATV